MRWGTRFLTTGGLLLLAACTRTVIVQPRPERQERGSRPPPRTAPEPDRPPPPPVRTYEVLIPPGQLPDPGQCRVWIPGRVPGRQPRPRSRLCAGIEAIAPAGSWIVYRRADDPSWVYLRVMDERRPGIVIRNRIYDGQTWEMVRDDDARDEQRPDDRREQERRRDPQERPRDPVERPREQPVNPQTPPVLLAPTGNRPTEPKPPEQQPVQPPANQPPANQPPPNQPPGPSGTLTLDIPPGHLPELGECRLWIPGLPPGRQPRPKSRPCDGITSIAPAGSWIIDRPRAEPTLVYVRLVDERRAGVVVRIRVFDLDSKRLLREVNP